MIPLSSIKPMPCLAPGSVAVVVETGDQNPEAPSGEVTIADVTGLQAALDGKATIEQGNKADSAAQPNTAVNFSTVNVGAAPAFLTPNLTFGASNNGFSSQDGVRTDVIVGGAQKAFWHRDQGFFFFSLLGASRLSCNPFTSSPDPYLEQEDSGLFAITSLGGYRDLKLRDLIATRYVRPASYTVAAANALVGVPDGARIQVSNDANGSIPAFYRTGTGWLRYDNTAIST